MPSDEWVQDPVNGQGWTPFFDTENRMFMQCCDCKLVHVFEFIGSPSGMVFMRARRDERKTSALRRLWDWTIGV